jgi:hypothetical protein
VLLYAQDLIMIWAMSWLKFFRQLRKRKKKQVIFLFSGVPKHIPYLPFTESLFLKW